jgi:adenine-specific DNA-methyltransferase
MPTKEQLRSRLIKKLHELFQIDQPDLDFGFYRIMHAKSQQVSEFLDKDLLKKIEDAFGQIDDTKKAKLQAAYEKAIQAAKEFGVAKPEETDPVKKAKAALDAIKDSSAAESEIYDHLYRFFERYYDDGDFISRRYYTHETSGKAAPFAIPYNGEEVKLHWANADQYYIKTTEYFTNYTFDLWQTKEVRALRDQTQLWESFEKKDDTPLYVHFRIVDATEGEHGNVKASDANKRFFIIHKDKPVELSENGELVINFEYRSNPEKTGQERTWRDKRNSESVAVILASLEGMDSAKTYLRLLKVPAPTEKEKGRPLLAKYINQYTARNTMDYFIHKDLGGFLHRELDFYIKNEVMRLDDIENADVPAVETYLTKIKVLRNIASKLIDFLAQLENFQKKLWLKKKFVVETNYCITLDKIPEEFYPEIAANDKQRDEWVKLFAIDEIKQNLLDPEYSRPLTVEFLKANNMLVLDTCFFDDSFKNRLIASIKDFDNNLNGLLIHSENFQALSLLLEKFRKQIKCIYIDPPYNTKSSEILYKNSYKHSSWLSLMDNRLNISKQYMQDNCIYMIAIDEVEQEILGRIITLNFPDWEKSCISIIHNPSGQQGDNFSYIHDFTYFIYPKPGRYIGLENREDNTDVRPLRDVSKGDHLRTDAANCFYPIHVKNREIIGFGDVCPDDYHPESVNITRDDGVMEIYPIDPQGNERKWVFARNTVERILSELSVEYNGQRKIWDIIRTKARFNYKTVWLDKKYSANSYGSRILNELMGFTAFSYPKSIHTVGNCIDAGLKNQHEGLILDFFAGSGTTGHAAINLNREDNGNRKYILVEIGDYFDTVLKPRIEKVVYTDSWKDGKPTSRDTSISHYFKYLRLESYEDTLNNLGFDDNPIRNTTVTNNSLLKEDYMIRYILDVETKGSLSLLNIDAFNDPKSYSLKIKKLGSDEYTVKNVDLIETFNYLIGLRVNHIAIPQQFNAKFKRNLDQELPQDQHTKLVIDGEIQQDDDGPWWFRFVKGWVPRDSMNPNNGQKENALIIWRKLTGDWEKDNLMLDEWFQKTWENIHELEFDTIYVNGSSNLQNLALSEDTWKVRLLEEEFMKRMWDVENV